ncbi:unnamed protein product [Vicia faba]|uniref:Uncharacterized protein n=1 Tax=Vicia faba TaxID=3906 RepID=A0AAV1B2H6_VICFA|nr:unnamed protein product [Vicia faba]
MESLILGDMKKATKLAIVKQNHLQRSMYCALICFILGILCINMFILTQGPLDINQHMSIEHEAHSVLRRGKASSSKKRKSLPSRRSWRARSASWPKKLKNWASVDDQDLFLRQLLLKQKEYILENNGVCHNESDLVKAPRLFDDIAIKLMQYYQDGNGDYYYLDMYGKIYEDWFKENDNTPKGYVPWKVLSSFVPPSTDSDALPPIMKSYLDVCVYVIMSDTQVREERLMARLDANVVEAMAMEDYMMAQFASIKDAFFAQKASSFNFDFDDFIAHPDPCPSHLQ